MVVSLQVGILLFLACATGFLLANADSLPESIDWREKGAVTSVKDSGRNCRGGSWAFAVAGAVEGAYQISTGQLLDLSPQQLLDCSKSLYTAGCSSGLPKYGIRYLVNDNAGIYTEEAYPFTGTSGTCQKKDGFIVAVDASSRFHPESDVTKIMEVVAKQPVAASLGVQSDAFNNYKRGIFKGPCSDSDLSQSVLIVGYGSENQEDYWIIKNSWGTSWGENGYMRLTRGMDKCGPFNVAWPIKNSSSAPTPASSSMGLVGWWKLNERTGAVAKDSSRSQATGTISGMIWWEFNDGLRFDGTGTNILCGSNASLCGKTPFSLVAWIKASSSTKSKGVIIQQRGPGNWSGQWTTDGYNGEYQLYVENNGIPSFWVYGDLSHQFRISASVQVDDGKWHHIVAVRDGREGRIYVDGKLSGSATGDVKNLVSNLPVYIGCDCRDNVDYFKGMLWDVRIYKHALSGSEITKLAITTAPKGALLSALS